MLMRAVISTLLLLSAFSPAASWAQSPPPASAAAAHYTTQDTDLGTLLDDPAAKAVLLKYIPTIINNDQIDQARSMTLKSLQGYAGDTLTDKALADIDAEFAKLPAKK
jgi:hypothetical protein